MICALFKIFYHYLPHELKLGHKNFCFLSFWHLIKKNKCIIFLSQNFQWGRIWVKRLYTILICQQICKCTFGDEQLTKLQDWLSLKTELTSFVLRLSSRELCRIPEKEKKSLKSVFNDLSSKEFKISKNWSSLDISGTVLIRILENPLRGQSHSWFLQWINCWLAQGYKNNHCN